MTSVRANIFKENEFILAYIDISNWYNFYKENWVFLIAIDVFHPMARLWEVVVIVNTYECLQLRVMHMIIYIP